MKTVKVSGKTIADAIDEALRLLGTDSKENVEYTVLEEPSKGFLGFIGAKQALIEASLKPDPTEEAFLFLRNVIEAMNVEAAVEVRENGKEVEFLLSGEDIGVLIGKRGKTLDSLQYLVNLAANRQSDRYTHIVLDAENYRARRQEALVQLAHRLAEKAKRIGGEVTLEPMNARERKIIHAALQNKEGVQTHSNGAEPRRHVVITPKR
ncbi:RNA-binding cell elongation regulator Jag/EloR [Bacillus piscicola]|uniref:RNA-binding cell elongation regulator Jag/EloR n=1 Tax=Bacillus piscicola TaxID=1632684 RepID=UPI001F0996B9